MKNRFTFSLLGIIIFSAFIFSHTLFAADTLPSPSAQQQSAPVATVNIQKTAVISQSGNVFTLGFDISNREMTQTGVKYGVKLVSKAKDVQTLVDEKVYGESLTIPENTTIHKEITYTAPANLSGVYSLVLFSSNSSGFPFGISFVKDVTLVASSKGFTIGTDSCYLKVEGDEKNIHYGLLQNVDISKDETLRLTCNTVNQTNNSLSLTPTFETRYHSLYGDIAPALGGDTASIAFKPLKSENFSILLPKGTTPQLYNLTMNLTDGNVTSNTVSLQYVVRGARATILNLTLDKDYYNKGEVANLSLIWTGSSSSDKYIRGSGEENASGLFVDTKIVNENTKSCMVPSTQALVKGVSPVTVISIPVTASCVNPTVSITIKDGTGTVLDQKDFSIPTTSEHTQAQSYSYLVWVLIVIAVIIIIVTIRVRRKKIKEREYVYTDITSN